MTPRQIAEQASTIRTGYGTRRDFDEPRELVFSEDDALPDEETCPGCDEPMTDGRCETCNPRGDGQWDYLDDLSPRERKQEEAYQRACARGYED